MADHHERRRRVPVQARLRLGEVVRLLAHLHVQHGEARRHLGALHRLAAARDADGEVVRDGGAVRRQVELEAVPVALDDACHGAGADRRGGLPRLGEGLRRRGQAREHGRREHGAGDEDDLPAD